MSLDDRHTPLFDDDPRPRRPRRGDPPASRPLLLLLAVVIGIGLGAAVYWAGGRVAHWLRGDPPALNPEAKPREAVPGGPLDAEEAEAHGLFEQCKASVVSVNLVLRRRGAFELPEDEGAGAGSGFVWDADGRIVTNFHVIQDAMRRNDIAVRVVMDGPPARLDARIVGAAPEYDLAVVQVSAPRDRLRPIEVGTSGDLKVGQKAFAIGNPFELAGTLTKGIISALDRPTRSPTGSVIRGCIQHTAAINPGNSGGPLLNRFGRLIGVNSSIITPSGGNVGIGFAIPVDTVNHVVTEIIRHGRLPRPDLGVGLFDQQRLRRAGYPEGVMIAEVVPGGPAAQAGLRGVRPDPRTGRLRPGDLILAINGERVGGVEDFQRIVAGLRPGQQVTVRYMRDEEEREATLTVRGV
jgi:S1-C subfamily serine protease